MLETGLHLGQCRLEEGTHSLLTVADERRENVRKKKEKEEKPKANKQLVKGLHFIHIFYKIAIYAVCYN